MELEQQVKYKQNTNNINKLRHKQSVIGQKWTYFMDIGDQHYIIFPDIANNEVIMYKLYIK